MIDAHTHLNSDQLYPQREKLVKEFHNVWWSGLVNIWVNNIRNERALEIQKEFNKKPLSNFTISTTLWLHPWETTFWDIISIDIAQKKIQQLKELIQTNKSSIVAIGECGIDSHFEWNESIQQIQTFLFNQQCQLARSHNLPIVIHSRDNFSLTLDILKDFKDLKIYFHCRWYKSDEIEKIQSSFSNIWIWFCGNLTYPKAHELRSSFEKALELDMNIMLETDAPYLAPQTVRWKENHPAYILHLYDWVTQKYNISSENIIDNINSFYNISGKSETIQH